jgi:hypothetical protein
VIFHEKITGSSAETGNAAMTIIELTCSHYPEPVRPPETVRFGDRAEVLAHPARQQVENAIRRLDRDEWPYVWLKTEEARDSEFPNYMLWIVGGRGEWAIVLFRDGDEIHFHDRARSEESSEMIRIWESDQGTYVWPSNLCSSIDVVLETARVFCETGELPELDGLRKWKVS